jgi:hypothetical protein
MLKVLGVGMPRTGTRSLIEALTILGYRTMHELANLWNLDALDMADELPDHVFRLGTDKVDAGTEAIYWRRIAMAHPEAKLVLTVRDRRAWFRSTNAHLQRIYGQFQTLYFQAAQRSAERHFGDARPMASLYCDRLENHNLFVKLWCAYMKRPLLEFDVTRGWKPLCDFLDKPVPNDPFPWKNRYATRERK